MADDKLVDIIRQQGVHAWNASREHTYYGIVNLNRADLGGYDLSGINLSNASLVESRLSFACLVGASLIETSLVRARLYSVDFSQANLTGASLSGANLDSAKFVGANLTNTSFADAYLSETDLTDADLTGARLVRAHLFDTNFSGANLSGADLSEASLRRTNFSGANLSGADLTGVDLTEADFSGAIGVDLDEIRNRYFDHTTEKPIENEKRNFSDIAETTIYNPEIMGDVTETINRLAAFLPVEQRQAFKTKVAAEFAAAGITTPGEALAETASLSVPVVAWRTLEAAELAARENMAPAPHPTDAAKEATTRKRRPRVTAPAKSSPRPPDLTMARMTAAYEVLVRDSDLTNPALVEDERLRRATRLLKTYNRLRKHDPDFHDSNDQLRAARRIERAHSRQNKKAKLQASEAAHI
jgi:uncharacterized protein YjbI with pentapeptide repeats